MEASTMQRLPDHPWPRGLDDERPASPKLRGRLSAAIFLLALALLPHPAAGQGAAGSFVWIEGESSSQTSFNRHNWYGDDGLRMNLLSPGTPGGQDGDWLAHFSDGPTEAEAEYRFDITQSGSYAFWLRASAYQVRMWYSLDDGPRVDIDSDSDPREYLRLNDPSGPNPIDLRFIAWFRLGDLDLDAGAHRLRMGLAPRRLNGNEMTHGGIDAIALVDFDWAPTGALRPDPDPPTPARDAWFPLIPTDDPFSPDSVTDASALLHRPAGVHGAMQRRGDDLAFADGSPVKLWGVNASIGGSDAVMQRQARHYAKNGINLVRLHPVQAELGLLQRDPASGERSLDPARLDRLDRWFAALKAEGIYLQWSLFYPHTITPDDGYPADLYAELPDGGGGKRTSGYVNYMPQLQAAEWEWARRLLDHVNPYTGLRYAEDPALAVVEVHNEDSIFWHFPLNPLESGRDGDRPIPRHQAELQRMWMEWLADRYGSDAALLAAWGPNGRGSRAGDSIANPRMPIYGAWMMEADGPWNAKGERARMGDFIRFLAETQRGYFAARVDALRGIGFAGVTVSTAWMAGGPAAELANLYTDDAADMIDRHSYFGGHNSDPFYRITEGPINNASHLGAPGSGILARGFEQLEDKPFMLSEWSQQPPNEWKAEIAPLYAFYGMGLNGWDASTHFHSALPRIGGGWPSDNTPWSSDTPHYMGQFPALARSIHRGDLNEGEIVAARRLELDEAFSGIDALRQPRPAGGWGPGENSLSTPGEIFAMGRVTTHLDTPADDLGDPQRVPWNVFWDRDGRVVNSVTGQLRWDYGRRVVSVDADRTQAIIGFAGGGSYDLAAARVSVTTDFVDLIFTALDDRPLVESGHILVTALARDRPTGARYSEDGSALLDYGGPPLMLEPVQARIQWRGAPLLSARALDIHGQPTGTDLDLQGDSFDIDGRYTTYLYELRTEAAVVEPTPSAAATQPSPTHTGPATPDLPSPTPSPWPDGNATRSYLPWLGNQP
jgi:hypothetical protein